MTTFHNVEDGPTQVSGLLRGTKRELSNGEIEWLIDDFVSEDGTEFEFRTDTDGLVYCGPKTPPNTTKYTTVSV